VVQRVQDLLNLDARALNGSRVLLLGVTYKADIADQRESPATDVAEHLRLGGAVVSFHDPYVQRWAVGDRELEVVPDLDDAVAEADLVVLLAAHTSYDLADVGSRARRLLDTRGVVPAGPGVEWL